MTGRETHEEAERTSRRGGRPVEAKPTISNRVTGQ
jgi:hypothetical protein